MGSFDAAADRETLVAAGVGTWALDLRTWGATWSEGLAQLYGLPEAPARPTQDDWMRCIVPEDRERVASLVRDAIAAGARADLEYRVRLPDGGVRWIISRGAPVRSASGEIAEYRGIAFEAGDLAARAAAGRTAQALRESEAKYHGLVEGAVDAFFLHDFEGRLREVNRVACESLGYTRAELLALRVTDLATDHDLPAAREVWSQIGPGRPVTVVGRHRRKDGSTFPVEARVTALEIGGERLVMAIARDITAQRMADAALRASEQLYRDMAELSPVAVLITRELSPFYVNRAAVELFGADRPEQILGRGPHQMIHPEDLPRMGAQIRKTSSGGRHPPVECRIVRLDGAVRHVWTDATLIPDAEGHVIQVLLQDITARRQAERERESLQAQLSQSQKLESVGRLAGGVAHDFNNLLTIILSCAEALRARAGTTPEERAEAVEDISAAGKRAAELTQQLLAFARKQVLSPTTLDLNGLLRESRKLLGRVIGEDVHVVEALDPAVWPVRADPGLVSQVVMNLSVNARDAMPRGGTLTLATAGVTLAPGEPPPAPEMAPGEWVRLTVQDTGVGMTPEVQAHAFEPFYTTKEPGAGTGLGLATVYGIVKQSGGHLVLRSAPGEGTAFDIYLPRAAPEPDEAVLPAPTPAPGHETVLVVEDEAKVRDITARALRDGGYQVLAAGGAEEAIELVRRHGRLHLVVTDVVMAGTGGRELARRICELRPGIRVLYVSGYTHETISRHGVLEEGIAFLPKPFTASTLLARVRTILDGR